MDLIYELGGDPAQGHPNLVLRHKVVILHNRKAKKNNFSVGAGRE